MNKTSARLLRAAGVKKEKEKDFGGKTARNPSIPQFSPPPEMESQSEFSFVDLSSSSTHLYGERKENNFRKAFTSSSPIPAFFFLLFLFSSLSLLFLGKRKASVKATVQRREEKRRWRKEIRTGKKSPFFAFRAD